MKHEYDLFEKLTDGLSLWRDAATGFETTRLRLQDLARRSENQSYAIDLITGKILAFTLERDVLRFSTPKNIERKCQSQSQVGWVG